MLLGKRKSKIKKSGWAKESVEEEDTPNYMRYYLSITILQAIKYADDVQ